MNASNQNYFSIILFIIFFINACITSAGVETDTKFSLKKVDTSAELLQQLSDILNTDESQPDHQGCYKETTYTKHETQLRKAIKLLEPDQTLQLNHDSTTKKIRPTIYQSARINAHILHNYTLPDISTAHALESTCDTNPKSERCLKIRNWDFMGVFSYDEKHKHRYIYTESVCDCIAVILWAKKRQKACFAHFNRQHINEKTLTEMKDLLNKPLSDNTKDSQDIKMTAIGGDTCFLMENEGLIPTLEKFSKKNNVEIKQTFLGNTKPENNRPRNIIYDVKEGIAHRLDRTLDLDNLRKWKHVNSEEASSFPTLPKEFEVKIGENKWSRCDIISDQDTGYIDNIIVTGISPGSPSR